MSIRVGINGFGRIGRNFFRAAKEQGADIDFVAANDLGSDEMMAHLFKHDSVLGRLRSEVKATGDGLNIDGDEFKILSERHPNAFSLGDLGAAVVVESPAFFTDRDK